MTNHSSEARMDIRSLQKPLKEQYRSDPNASRITLRAKGGQTDVPVACSVDIGRAIYQAEAHKGVGGAGAGACSGDLLLGALAACAQITCQMVAAAMGIPTEHIEVTVEGKWNIQVNFGRKNRTVLCSDADLNAAAEVADRMGWSGLSTRPREQRRSAEQTKSRSPIPR